MQQRSILLVVPVMLFIGCKACEPPPLPAEPQGKTKQAQAPSISTPLNDPKGLDQACANLHDQMKGRVALIRQRRGDTSGKFPARDAVLKACKDLPPAAVRCMIADVARAHGPECRSMYRAMKPEQIQKIAAFRSFLWTGSWSKVPPPRGPTPKGPPPKRPPPKEMPKK